MPRSLDSTPGFQAAPTALSAGVAPTAPVRRATAKGDSARPVDALYRVRPGHLYMANAFRDGPDKAYRGEVQKVLQTLRWDPVDGRLLSLAARPWAAGQGGHPATGGDRTKATWNFGLGSEVVDWLGERGLDRNLRDTRGDPRPGLSLLELCSCVTLDPGSEDAVASRAVLEAQSARVNRAVHAGSARFYWRRSYHLALPGAMGLGESALSDQCWHAEGGQYQAGAPIFDGPVWRRRSRELPGGGLSDPLSRDHEPGVENSRPADSFDPRPAYRFDGLGAEDADQADPEGSAPGAVRGLRFRPFVLRVGGLEPWPPNQLLRDLAGIEEPRRRADLEQGGLAAWYRPCPAEPTMTWAVSPGLDA